MKEFEENNKIMLLHFITSSVIFKSSEYFFSVLNISLCESKESFEPYNLLYAKIYKGLPKEHVLIF